MLNPPHAIVVRLYGRESYIIILLPEMVDLLDLRDVAGLIDRIRHPG